ncbi:MAG TPA: exodeoxyribonuclease III [Legionellales bacterium]|nr:exodeoxyribonuclease III [Legionellales bacterium]
MFKIASWNVNSLKVRLPQVLDWLEDSQIDVLGIQETKLEDSAFPKEYFEEAGFEVNFVGQKTYNGVAWISRHPMEDRIDALPDFVDEQKRVLAVTIKGIRFINFYIPNGQALDSPKYQYKLAWLEKMLEFVQQQMQKYPQVVILGDFNIAPDDIDVYDPKQWFGEVLVSEPERLAFDKLKRLGLVDILRHLHPDEDNLYSWWDYRAAAFRRGMGLRIDHILMSQNLVKDCIAAGVDKEPRKHERPSDHAPVWLTLAV